MKTLIMGVGDAGTKILKTFAVQPDWTRLAVDTTVESLERSGIENVWAFFTLPIDDKETHREFEKLLSDYQRLVVIAGFGGLAGTSIAPYAARLGQQLGLQVLLVAVIPFPFEGKRYQRATKAVEQLKPGSIPLRVFENGSLQQAYPSLTLGEAFSKMSQHIQENIKSALASSSAPTSDTFARRQIAFDTETTGLYAKNERIIEIGCVEMIEGKRTGKRRHWYLNPKQPINEAVVAIHGLDNNLLADKPTFAEIVDDLLCFIKGAELVIHNAPFDVSFLNAELARLGHKETIESLCDILDTLPIARGLNPGQRCDLDALCERYGVDNSKRQQHGALLDAELLADVYFAMLKSDD